jgi:predicted secreted Zn-dependent protease
VTVSLVAAETWVVTGTRTAALLDHERLHYVIATLVGRELERELTALKGADVPAALQAADNLVRAKSDRAQAIGRAYDDDTNHGQDVGQQRLWQGRVHTWEHDHNRVSWP